MFLYMFPKDEDGLHPNIPIYNDLMLSRGEDGWHPNIPHNDEVFEISDEDEANISMNYFAY